MQLQSIFSYFPTRIPLEDDIEDGVVVVMTPKGATWDVDNQNFADNKQSVTNKKGELCPPMYEHKEFVGKDDLANINLITVMDDNVNRHNKDTVISAFEAQDVEFTENEVDIGY